MSGPVGAHDGRPLTFAEVTQANTTRCKRWHPGFLDDDKTWTGADWSNAVCGEAGEMANVVKKLRRLEAGIGPGMNDPPEAELRRMLADEIADVFIYLDLLAAYYRIDLQDAIVDKFNRVSERQGFPDRLDDLRPRRPSDIFGPIPKVRHGW